MRAIRTLAPLVLAAAFAAACDGQSIGVVPGTSDPAGPVQATPIAERYPVVAMGNLDRAIVMSRGRVAEDANRPVQQFAQFIDLQSGPQGASQGLAGITADTFVASGRPGFFGRNHALALAGDGSAAFTLWLGDENNTVNLYANLGGPGGNFGTRQLLASGLAAAGEQNKRIAADSRGNALAVWLGNDGLQRARVYRDGVGWEAEATIPQSAMSIMGDSAMQEGRGWHTWIAGDGMVYAAQVFGITWRQPVAVGRASYLFGPPPPPRIAWHAQALGADPMVVWRGEDGVRYARLRPDDTVEPAGGALLPVDSGDRPVQVAMSANGDVAAVWNLFANVFSGGAWSVPTATGIRDARVAADARGNFLVAGNNPVNGLVAVNRYAAGSGWLGVESFDTFSLAPVDVAMDDRGRGMVVWEVPNADTPQPADTRIAWRAVGVPNAVLSVAPNPTSVGVPVAFDGSASSDPLGAITRYEWDFGDGVQLSGAVATHAYATPGTYSASLTVFDATGLSARGTQTVTVGGTAQANLLINPDFDVPANIGGLPTAPANWRGDAVEVVPAENGIAPRSAPNMLRFYAAGNVSSTNTEASQQWQIVDLAPHASDIAAGRARADGSVWFNRVIGNLNTDRRFDLRLIAFAGPMSELPTRYVAGNWLAQQTTTVNSIGLQWQQAVASLVLPPGTTYLLFEIYAFEDVVNDGAGSNEFDGHYADDALLVINTH